MAGRKRRGTSFGTVVMLILTVVILVSSGIVLLQLGSGHSVDLSGIRAQVVSMTAPVGETDQPAGETPGLKTNEPAVTKSAAATPPPAERGKRQTVLTFGGTIAIEDQIRKSAFTSDTKKYDFTDFFMLLKAENQGSLSGAFLENLLMDDVKVSSVIVPSSGAETLKSAGFSMAFSAFGKAWEKSETGIQSTIHALQENGITPLGLVETEQEKRYILQEVDGIRIAMMQYTTLVASNTRKTMQKRSADYMIPEGDPELIATDIASAKAEGAEVIVVLLNWGKVGGKTPEKTQLALAQQIADSGADLIIGAGSRVPQMVEALLSADGRKVICAYSLGTLISDNRKSIQRMSGFLLHVALEAEGEQNVSIGQVTYTPTYIWKFRQDSRDYYRVIASDRSAPDGMDSDQVKQMQKSLASVQETLESSPVSIR